MPSCIAGSNPVLSALSRPEENDTQETLAATPGEVAERPNALALKARVGNTTLGSNPSLTARPRVSMRGDECRVS